MRTTPPTTDQFLVSWPVTGPPKVLLPKVTPSTHPCEHCGGPVKKVTATVCQRCAASFIGHRHTKNNPIILKRAQAKSVWAKKARALARTVLACTTK